MDDPTQRILTITEIPKTIDLGELQRFFLELDLGCKVLVGSAVQHNNIEANMLLKCFYKFKTFINFSFFVNFQSCSQNFKNICEFKQCP